MSQTGEEQYRNRRQDQNAEPRRELAPGSAGEQVAVDVRECLTDRLRSNYGDRVYVRAKALAHETGHSATVVGHSINHLTGEWIPAVEPGPIAVHIDRDLRRQRYVVQWRSAAAPDRELPESTIRLDPDLVRPDVVDAIHRRLDANYGDSLYGRIRKFSRHVVYDSQTTAQVLRWIAENEADPRADGIQVRVRDEPNRQRYEVTRSERGGSA